MQDINLSHVSYFHNIRNKLYHESDSITIPRKNVYNYALIATQLLKVLLSVDLSDELNKPQRQEDLKSLYEIKKQKESIELNELRKELELCIELLKPELLLPSFKNAIKDIDESQPSEAVWKLCNLIEKTFSVDFNKCFSERDIKIVNKHLNETTETNIADYNSPKDNILRVMSGSLGWEFIEISNLPIGKYKVSSLCFEDFLYFQSDISFKDFSNVFLKVVCEIVDADNIKNKKGDSNISLMEEAKKM